MFAYFNPQGSREPRRYTVCIHKAEYLFQSTRLSRASTQIADLLGDKYAFQSTRLSRASTGDAPARVSSISISIHKALASLDRTAWCHTTRRQDFNPQGSREPRQELCRMFGQILEISIHKALASLDPERFGAMEPLNNFNPQGSREPRPL